MAQAVKLARVPVLLFYNSHTDREWSARMRSGVYATAGRPSVCLSVPSLVRRCCSSPPAVKRYRSTARQQLQGNAGSATLTADVGSWTQTGLRREILWRWASAESARCAETVALARRPRRWMTGTWKCARETPINSLCWTARRRCHSSISVRAPARSNTPSRSSQVDNRCDALAALSPWNRLSGGYL